MSQQPALAVYAYDSMDGRTDDEQEHQAPPPTKEQSRVSFCVQNWRARKLQGEPTSVESWIQLNSLLASRCLHALQINKMNKIRSFRVRTVSTFVLIGSFLGFIWGGHVPLMFMIFCIQVCCRCCWLAGHYHRLIGIVLTAVCYGEGVVSTSTESSTGVCN